MTEKSTQPKASLAAWIAISILMVLTIPNLSISISNRAGLNELSSLTNDLAGATVDAFRAAVRH